MASARSTRDSRFKIESTSPQAADHRVVRERVSVVKFRTDP
jgi:hypothetical protein